MIELFLTFLNEKKISYRVTNGYESILNGLKSESDHDIIFKKSDFLNIDAIIINFCNYHSYCIVQMYHQGAYAKNFFIYDKASNELLNLDLYGELSRQRIEILNEAEIFQTRTKYNGISILRPHQEFIQYLIKKIDKGRISQPIFKHLKQLYQKEEKECNTFLKRFFSAKHQQIAIAIRANDFDYLEEHMTSLRDDFIASKKDASAHIIKNSFRFLKRIFKPTGSAIAFLGPDGAGKSTIIEGLINQTLPFRRQDYFHLKPIIKKKGEVQKIVTNPHKFNPYSPFKSYLKLLFFIFQYNLGWIKNIVPIKIKSSVVIFDRYYDDLLVDHKRYRYGGNKKIAKIVRQVIPKPALYFILTADADIIYKRKQEVPLEELGRQIKGYRELVDGKRYFNIDVNRRPEDIILEITKILMWKMNERY